MAGLALSMSAQRLHVHTTGAGQLAEKLEAYGEGYPPLYVLFVDGPINSADFATMREYCNGRDLRQIDLSRAEIEGNAVPGNAFFDSGNDGKSKLEFVILPEKVREIGDNAFRDCVSLTYMNFPASLEKIGDYAFAGTMMRGANLPAKCLDLGDGVFSGSRIVAITLPEGLKAIPPHFAEGAAGLMTIHIPGLVERISENAFTSCQNLSHIDLPEGLREIGREAFLECSSVVDIDLPSTLTNLSIFSLITTESDIDYLICRATTPPECEIVFESSSQTDPNFATTPFFDNWSNVIPLNPFAPVYVPSGTGEAYRSAKGWGYFRNIIETDDFSRSAVCSPVRDSTGMRIYSRGLDIIVETPKAGYVTVTSIDGRSRACKVTQGHNALTGFAPGVYIVDSTKLCLR